jgi:hypothetical protein
VPIARATNGFLMQVKVCLDRVSSIADDDLREAHLATLRKAQDILEAHAAEEAAISVDPNLSEQGQVTRVRELAKRTQVKLMFLAEKADEADAAYPRAEALVYAVPDAPKGANEVVQFLREDSIRRRLEPLSVAERMARYQVAVQRGDVETIRAIRLGPGEPLIPDDVRERIDRQRADVANAKGMRRLRSLETVRSQLHELADSLLGWLKGYGADIRFPTPDMKAAQYLVGYGHEVKFPVAPITPAPKPSRGQ